MNAAQFYTRPPLHRAVSFSPPVFGTVGFKLLDSERSRGATGAQSVVLSLAANFCTVVAVANVDRKKKKKNRKRRRVMTFKIFLFPYTHTTPVYIYTKMF